MFTRLIRARTGWLVLLAGGLLGCHETSSSPAADGTEAPDVLETGADDAEDAAEIRIDPDVRREDPIARCAPRLAWWTANPGPDFLYGSPDVQVAPGERLLTRRDPMGDAYFRVRDGASLGHDTRADTGPLDGAWSRRLGAGADSVVTVREVASDQALLLLDELEGQPFEATGRVGSPGLAWLEDDGLAVVRSCWLTKAGDERVTVTAWHLTDGARAWQSALAGGCDTYSWLEAPFVVPAGPGRLLTAAPSSASLVLLRTSDGAAIAETPLPSPAADAAIPTGSWPGEALLALAVRPDGTEVAFTTLDGHLHRRTLPDLAAIGEPLPVGVVSINLMSYGPSVESPVAWSPDGTTLAHLAPNGDAAMTDVATHSEIARWSPPVAEPDPTLYPEGTPNPVTAFRFLPAGDGLLTAHERGVALWTCTGDAPSAGDPSPLAVTLSVPLPQPVATPFSAEVAVTGADAPVVVQLWLGDEPLDFASTLGGHLELWLAEGAHLLVAKADDGLSSATSEPVSIDVTPTR
jgi:hypothetical protein